MSDLLSRIIRRATQPTAGIVPVTPSIYEGVPPIAQEPAVAPVRLPPRRVPVAHRQESRPPEAAEPADFVTPAKFDAPEPVAPDREMEPLPLIEPPRPTRLRQVSEAPARMEDPAPQPAAATIRQAPASLRQPSSAQPAQAAQTAVVPAPRIGESRTTQPAAAPPVEPVEVHVFIGHIELRQAAPPPPPPRRPTPITHVRLEDYLKRRAGDKR